MKTKNQPADEAETHEEDDEGQEKTPVVAQPATDDPPPWAKTLSDDVRNLREENAYLRGRVEAGAQPERKVVVTDNDVTDDEIIKAVDEGDGRAVAELMRRQSDISARRAVRNLRETEIEPMRNQFVTVGAQHTKILSSQGLKHMTNPKVAAYVDQVLGTLTPEQRVNPESIKFAYKQALGEYHDEIVDEELEQRTRANLHDGGGDPGSGSPGRTTKRNAVPSATDLGGNDARIAADEKGGEDGLARKLGYASWADYMKQTGMTETVQ